MPNVAGNPLPNHTDQGVNGIRESKNKKIKCEVAKVRTPLRQVWREMVMRGLIALDLGRESKKERNYCEFHNEVGHEIQECVEFRALVQNMMNNKEMEFYEETKNPVEGDICPSEGESTRPAVFPYKDSKRVPWNYDCNVTIPGKESLVDTLKEDQDRGSYTRSGRRYDIAINEEEAKEFLKFLKHSEYSVVEQLHKQPARISVLALLLSSEVHRSALMKVLNETYVANDISGNKLDRLVSNISAENYIFFNDDEIPPGGMGSTKALHITTRCKGYTLPGVLIDNGSALNILPLTTLNRLPVDSFHMKECQNIVKAFDGTERKVIGRIEVPLQIGPIIYEVDFLVMDIKPSYNCLMGRPWIHSAGAVPSSLHQKLKLVSEERLIMINAEEDIIATVSNNAPYLETDDETIECSFRSLEFVNVTFITEGSKILVPKLSKTTRISLQLTIEKGALPGRGLGRHLQGRVETPMPKDKRDRFGLGFKPDAKQMRIELGKKQERRRARLTGEEIKWEPMTFPHISKTFVSGGIIHPERDTLMTGAIEERLESLDINVICEEETGRENFSGIYLCKPGSVLDNWTAEEIPVAFRTDSE
ncbi:uncharacterized protein LOC108468559 [Gossypium arboreum]|uniref:uncharacterized protein LOC108468559 n=1 Tax=Gossypium arboreum TaxID=29729 RepID=UPI0022F1921D|nr:uncharacterized protein LOC108468559 [Gossypium arboreum]